MALIQGKLTSFTAVQTCGQECVFNVNVLYENKKYIFSIGEINFSRIIECIQSDVITLRTENSSYKEPPMLNQATLCNNSAFDTQRENHSSDSSDSILHTFEKSLKKIKAKLKSGSIRPLQSKRRRKRTTSDDLEFLQSDGEEKKEKNYQGLFCLQNDKNT